MACGFTGNPDVYGIGIRIGYYTQALAVWFSNYFFFREAKILRAANHLFLIALVIVGFIYAYRAQTTYAIEAFLLLQIGLCIGSVSIQGSTRFSSRYMKTSRQRLALRTVIINVGLLFNICFWWKGLDVMLPTPCESSGTIDSQRDTHGTYACYAFRTNIYGWMRTLMKVVSLAALVWITLLVTGRDAGDMVQRVRMKHARADFIDSNPKAKSMGSKNADPRSRGFLPQDDGKHCLGEAVGHLPRELDPRESLQRSPLPEDPITPTKQGAASETREDNKVSKKGVPKACVISYAGIRDAEIYLDSIFSLYSRNTAGLGRKRILHLFRGRTHIYIPRLSYQRDPKSARYIRCIWTTIKADWVNKPPMNLRWRLGSHFATLGQHPVWRWPRFLHRMCEINETQEPPHWHLLTIASDVQLSEMPFTMTPKVWTFMAMDNLIVIIALIVQVELTISWNHVSGLQDLNTLGQLIPFILGVGGLLKVLWGKWCMVRKGIKEFPREEEDHRGEYEAAIERYIQWKNEVDVRVTVADLTPERTSMPA